MRGLRPGGPPGVRAHPRPRPRGRLSTSQWVVAACLVLLSQHVGGAGGDPLPVTTHALLRGGGAALRGWGDHAGAGARRLLPVGCVLRGGEDSSVELQRMDSSSEEEGGGGDKKASEEEKYKGGVMAEGSSILDETGEGGVEEVLPEEDMGGGDTVVYDPFDEDAKKRRKEKEEEEEEEEEDTATAVPKWGDPEESAEDGDKTEAEAPFYNGARVRNLFMDEDTGAKQWCVGTVQYVKASTGEYRIHFDTVPSWEKSTKLYWPQGDDDMQLMPGQEAKTEEEKLELTVRMLQAAAEREWFLVRKMVFMGADAGAQDPECAGMSALHYAAMDASPDMVSFLLDNGANPCVPTDDGNTPLHWAACSGSEDVVRALVRSGASALARNHDDIQPIENAVLFENKACERMLAKVMMRAQAARKAEPAGSEAQPGGGGGGGSAGRAGK